jgi:hypothetical protein
MLQEKIAGTLPCKFSDATSSVSELSVRHVRLQAISVIVTHRTDDMSKLPPRLPINAPEPRSKPAQTDRPKLRLNQPAQAAEAAPICLAPNPSDIGVDVVMGEEGVLLEQSGEIMGSGTVAEAAADGAASPAAINAGELQQRSPAFYGSKCNHSVASASQKLNMCMLCVQRWFCDIHTSLCPRKD